MPFPSKIKEDALVNSRRCCCVCHEFAGLYTNVHHIQPEASGGPSTIDNAIVLCLTCHGQAGHYNPSHPIGNKYSPDELRRHRDEWWKYCEKNPTKSFPTHPISISPSSFRLVFGEWKTKQHVKVTNRSEVPLYDIAVKFTIRINDVKAEDIVSEPTKTERELKHAMGDLEFSGDVVRVNGIDAAGYQAFMIYIHAINPQDTITLILTNDAKSIPSPQTQQHAVISLLGFSEEPTEMLIQPDKAAVKIEFFEDWQLTGVGVLLKAI